MRILLSSFSDHVKAEAVSTSYYKDVFVPKLIEILKAGKAVEHRYILKNAEVEFSQCLSARYELSRATLVFAESFGEFSNYSRGTLSSIINLTQKVDEA